MGTFSNPNGKWVNKERLGNWVFIYPVFKFMERVHLDRFNATGELYIPTLHEFKDKDKYNGTILDDAEGVFRIKNTYSYTGLVKDSYGLLPTKIPPYQFIHLQNQVIEEEHVETSSIVYCAADSFFSDSLTWAVKHKKDSCIMIVDLHEFIDIATQYIGDEHTRVDVRPCDYSGRFVDESNPGPESLTTQHLIDPVKRLFVKPITHVDQHEVRAVWRTAKGEAKPCKIQVPLLRNFTVPLNFPTITLENWSKAKAGIGAVGVRVKKRDGQMGVVIAKIPSDITSPVVFRHKGGWKLGFRYINPTGRIENGIFICESPPHILNGNALFQMCDMENIEYVEYFYDPDFDKRHAESMKAAPQTQL